MQTSEYLGHIRADGDRLIEVARSIPDVSVPSCPGWEVRDLVGHIAGVHDWVARILAEQSKTRLVRQRGDELRGDFGALVAEYESGLDRLLAQLSETDPEEQVWNWSARAPAPARFWFRRMGQETVVHRFDAELAAGKPSPIEPTFAVDGIDEYLGLVASFIPREPIEGLSGSLGFEASDVGVSWQVELEPDRLERLSSSRVDATVRGPAFDLYRWILHRDAADALEIGIDGDREVAMRWELVKFD